ncbi:MAG: hypothetical protein AB1345_14570 [Chloroflexota bacterium]
MFAQGNSFPVASSQGLACPLYRVDPGNGSFNASPDLILPSGNIIRPRQLVNVDRAIRFEVD